jgi:hypothetical protein
MAKNVVVIRPFVIDGDTKLADAVVEVSDDFAAELVARGDASYQTPLTETVEVRTDIKINSASIADSTSAGRAVLMAANAAAQRTALGAGAMGGPVFVSADLTAVLAALGVSLGANDSGGTGKRALVVNNA